MSRKETKKLLKMNTLKSKDLDVAEILTATMKKSPLMQPDDYDDDYEPGAGPAL